MKSKLWIVALFLALMMLGSIAFAVEVLPINGSHEAKEVPEEPIVTLDSRAVQIGVRDNLVENDELEDHGTVWVEWNGKAYALYGCTTAEINYTNPTRSNIGVTLSMAIFDADLMTYFGTTYRSESEQVELAKSGLAALRNGIKLSYASKLLEITNYFDGMTDEEVSNLTGDELVSLLASKGFLCLSEEELRKLEEDDLIQLTEKQRLELAELGDYNPNEYYRLIGEDGLINPGYAIYEIDLYTLPGRKVLPKGEYKAVFVLNGYAADKNEMSDFFIHLPIELIIQKDLPEDLQKEYSVSLAVRVDQ